MVSPKPEIWVKSYPKIEEIKAISNFVNGGIELFLDTNKSNSLKCLEVAKSNYSQVGIEMFATININNKELIYNFFSQDPKIKNASVKYLFDIISLANDFKVSHLQLNLCDGYLFRPNDKGVLQERKKRISKLVNFVRESGLNSDIPIYLENIFPISGLTKEIYISSIGHNLEDFNGLNLEYDLAHHALALDIYSRAKEFGLILNKSEQKLAEMVVDNGITQTILYQLNKINRIPFTHFSNASAFESGKKCDTSPENPKENLFNLKQILPILLEKSENITPEVGEPTGDFKIRPYLRKWINALQTGNYSEVL